MNQFLRNIEHGAIDDHVEPYGGTVDLVVRTLLPKAPPHFSDIATHRGPSPPASPLTGLNTACSDRSVWITSMAESYFDRHTVRGTHRIASGSPSAFENEWEGRADDACGAEEVDVDDAV